jgi:phosphoglucomutase
MALHPLAGKPAPASLIVNIPRLVTAYFAEKPDPHERAQRVEFGTSGHRGVAFARSFNEAHVLAITQAICEHRVRMNIRGPLFVGFDTHALSEPAFATTLEVLVANGVEVRVQAGLGYTPTPVVSHAVLGWNRGRTDGIADGIVITPSHNPPDGGGFKYDPPHGGPADSEVTRGIEERANALLSEGNAGVRRVPYATAIKAAVPFDFVTPYVAELARVVDMEAIKAGRIKLGVDPLGGSNVAFWAPIADRYGLDIDVVNPRVDPTFSFMTVDHDGKIRMDCSSPYAMASLIGLKDRYDIAFGNDADSDRHGIVTKTGLMNPNHYLAVAAGYLFKHRPDWPASAGVGKTLVSSGIIDRVAASLGRRLDEVPVGFKWFVKGLLEGTCGFAGEESAGAAFLRMDGTTWTTDKDGILLDLLAAEICVKTGKSPSEIYAGLTEQFGAPVYERTDAPATPAQKKALGNLTPDAVTRTELAGEPILERITRASSNGAPIGGLKVTTKSGWFAARPSGTEDVYKIYAESFQGPEHLRRIQAEAQAVVDDALRGAV